MADILWQHFTARIPNADYQKLPLPIFTRSRPAKRYLNVLYITNRRSRSVEAISEYANKNYSHDLDYKFCQTYV